MDKSKLKDVLSVALEVLIIIIGLTMCFILNVATGFLGIALLIAGIILGTKSKAAKVVKNIGDVFIQNAPDAFKAFMEGKAFEVTIDSPQKITVNTVEIKKD